MFKVDIEKAKSDKNYSRKKIEKSEMTMFICFNLLFITVISGVLLLPNPIAVIKFISFILLVCITLLCALLMQTPFKVISAFSKTYTVGFHHLWNQLKKIKRVLTRTNG